MINEKHRSLYNTFKRKDHHFKQLSKAKDQTPHSTYPQVLSFSSFANLSLLLLYLLFVCLYEFERKVFLEVLNH